MYFATCNQFFCIQDCTTWIFHVDYQGQTRNTRILERKPLIDTSYSIQHRLELKYQHLAQFCSMLIEQHINLEKVRTDDLEYWTDILDQVMEGWSVTQYKIVYYGRLLKESSNWKSKLVLSTLVTTWLSNIAFHLRPILLQTLVAIVANRFRIAPDIVFKLLRATMWSSCAVLFESEQTPFPWTGRQFRPAALHRILFGRCCFVHVSYFYSETNEW